MDLESLAALLDGFIFYGILYSLLLMALSAFKQCHIRKLCRYRGTGAGQWPRKPPGRGTAHCGK